MHQSQGFGQIFIKPQCIRELARDLRNFHRMGKPAPKMVGIAVREHLGFPGKPAKGSGMDDTGAIALEGGAVGICWLGMEPLLEKAASVVSDRTSRR